MNKNAKQVKEMMDNKGYETIIRNSSAIKVVSLNPTKERNITQIQVSLNGSRHHGSAPYVKVSTKDIGVIKIVNGDKSEYKEGQNERAKLIFKGGNKR